MHHNVTVPNAASAIIAFVSEYFDQMPPKSRVTYEDLVPLVATACKHHSHDYVRRLIRKIIDHRGDVAVMCGRGICKRG